jgi:pyridoxine kinase
MGDKLDDGREKMYLINSVAIFIYYLHFLSLLTRPFSCFSSIRQQLEPLRYVPEQLVDIYRREVVSMAQIITPNQLEAELLTGRKIYNLDDAVQACQTLHEKGPSLVVITSMILPDKGNEIYILGSVKKKDGTFDRWAFSVERKDVYLSGLGDLVSALLLAWNHLHPDDIELIVTKTIASVQAVVHRTISAGSKEILLVQSKNDIENPPVFSFIAKRRL